MKDGFIFIICICGWVCADLYFVIYIILIKRRFFKNIFKLLLNLLHIMQKIDWQLCVVQHFSLHFFLRIFAFFQKMFTSLYYLSCHISRASVDAGIIFCLYRYVLHRFVELDQERRLWERYECNGTSRWQV